MKQIGVIVGSLRKGSFSQAVANYVSEKLSQTYSMQCIDISQLPLYNEDLEGENPPDAWQAFRALAQQMDGFVFVTPEYNRSVPAALKNAIDVGSRPMDGNVWSDKPAAVISASPGKIGGFGANHHLRQSLVVLNMLTMAQPETYLGEIHQLVNEAGDTIADEGAAAFLDSVAAAFAHWVERVCND